MKCGLQAHLFTSHLLTQLLVKGMKEALYGRVINILSTSVKRPIWGLGSNGTENRLKDFQLLGCTVITILHLGDM